MMTAPDSDVAGLTQRLADARRGVDAAKGALEEALAAVRILEHDLAAAHAADAAAASHAAALRALNEPAAPAAPVAPAAAEPAAADPATDEAPSADAKPELTEEERILHGKLDRWRPALVKRGFRRDDLYYHQCPACSEQAVEKYALVGKPGGRDIDLCLACGQARSWRRRPEREDRELDATFDLPTFLRLP